MYVYVYTASSVYMCIYTCIGVYSIGCIYSYIYMYTYCIYLCVRILICMCTNVYMYVVGTFRTYFAKDLYIICNFIHISILVI